MTSEQWNPMKNAWGTDDVHQLQFEMAVFHSLKKVKNLGKEVSDTIFSTGLVKWYDEFLKCAPQWFIDDEEQYDRVNAIFAAGEAEVLANRRQREPTGAEDRTAICRTIERELFGDDMTANTDERVVEAIQGSGFTTLSIPDLEYAELRELYMSHRHLPWQVILWGQRSGKTYQAELEMEVSKHVREPRNFFEDWDAWKAMRLAAAERGWRITTSSMIHAGSESHETTIDHLGDFGWIMHTSNDLLESVVMAVYRALEGATT